jgi:tRNA pseudouridine55 synthase
MLRRLQVARYPIERMVTLEQLQEVAATVNMAETPDYSALDALLLPMDSPAEEFPMVNLLPTVAAYFKQGMPVQVADAPEQGLVRVTEGDEHKFIGMAEIADDGRVAPRRLVVEFPA